MQYSDLIKRYIKNSGYKLGELSALLEEEGLSASREYLSRLQNGKRPPASDELNVALAKITGNDPTELVFSAYIHKAPQNIKGILSGYFDILFNYKSNERLLKAAYDVEKKFPGFTKGIYKEEELRKEKVYRDYKELSKNFFERHLEDRLDISYEDRVRYNNNRNIQKVVRVPIMEFIKSNLSIFSDENITEWTYISNNWNLNKDEILIFKVPDNSMENSRIITNDLVVVKVTSEFKNGDLLVINIDGEEATIKKIKYLENGKALVYPSNEKDFEPLLIEMDRVRVIGKVIQVMFKPK